MISGPYRAEFGAVHHEDATGFLFTVSPPQSAVVVAEALNAGLVTAELALALKTLVTWVTDDSDIDSLEARTRGRLALIGARAALAKAGVTV